MHSMHCKDGAQLYLDRTRIEHVRLRDDVCRVDRFYECGQRRPVRAAHTRADGVCRWAEDLQSGNSTEKEVPSLVPCSFSTAIVTPPSGRSATTSARRTSVVPSAAVNMNSSITVPR